MVSPDNAIPHILWRNRNFGTYLRSRSVLVQSRQGSDIAFFDSLSVVGDDDSVGVGWVAHHDDFAIFVGEIVQKVRLSFEDLRVRFQ